VVLTASTPIIDVTGTEPRIVKGHVPPRAVVIPGTRPKVFPAGTYEVPCALIVGHRSESTDRAIVRGVTDYPRDPRKSEGDFRRLLGTSNDRGRDTVEKPLVPRVNGKPSRLDEKLIRSAEPGRLTRCENDRVTNHGRDS
jgi:hypothetical protein